jgi:predicted AlkP superfamily pyrophosphatase or phosphodiesterase
VRGLTVPLALALAAVVLPMSVSAQAMPVCGRGAGDRVPATVAKAAAGKTTKVVIVSLDSVGSRAIRLAGKQQAPTLHRLMRRGAGTLNARTAHELTWTLPNHTTMVTGRRVDAEYNGHGVWWNDERTDPATVQEAAGHAMSSVFRVAGGKDRETALFTAKEKLLIFERSWSDRIDRAVLDEDDAALARKARRDLVKNRRELTFLHLSYPDVVGHKEGFLSEAHLAAVEEADRLLGTLVSAIEARPRLRKHVTLIVTADHGGGTDGHGDATEPVNYRIPFIVWGADVAKGTDLYKLNTGDYRNPGKSRTKYGIKRPPIRNGDAANLATDLLGLRAVSGSQFNAGQSLDVR